MKYEMQTKSYKWQVIIKGLLKKIVTYLHYNEPINKKSSINNTQSHSHTHSKTQPSIKKHLRLHACT